MAPLAWAFNTCSPVGGSVWVANGEVQDCQRSRGEL